MSDIAEYTFGQFSMFMDAEEQLAAEQRISTVTDLATVVGSLFAKESPVAEHLGLLSDTAAGVKEWQQKHNST